VQAGNIDAIAAETLTQQPTRNAQVGLSSAWRQALQVAEVLVVAAELFVDRISERSRDW